MLEVGYSPHTASKPSNLTQSNGWKELTREWFQDEDVVRAHAEMLNAVCRKRYLFPLSTPDKVIREIIECDDSFRVVYIERRKRQKVAHYLAPDNHTIIKAIDLYCRVTGKYALGRQIAKGEIREDPYEQMSDEEIQQKVNELKKQIAKMNES
jgi:hypothetical protein